MIDQPTLILDETICMRNILQMKEKADRYGLIFRPHFKTHRSHYVGKMFRKLGVHSITVSSVSMAEFFAADDWGDITIAFPFNPLEIARVNLLARQCTLNLMLADADVLPSLEDLLENPTGIFIEIDCGYHRSGIAWNDEKRIAEIVQRIEKADMLEFKGFLTHTGQTYACRSKADVVALHETARVRMVNLKHRYPESMVSIGDTPGCTLAENFDNIDEIRPGNFVFFDWMQVQIGSCVPAQIALSVACPVVAKYPSRGEIVIYGGAVHLSKESIAIDGKPCYGAVCLWKENGWSEPLEECSVVRLSQEHGILSVTPEVLQKIQVGDRLDILPVHSCMSVSCMSGAFAEPHYHLINRTEES